MSEEQAYRADRELRSCPADSVDLGASTWKLLHTMSVNFPERPTERQRADVEQFFSLFGQLYPCKPCAEGSSTIFVHYFMVNCMWESILLCSKVSSTFETDSKLEYLESWF